MPKRSAAVLFALILALPGSACKKSTAQNMAEKRQQFQTQQRKKAVDNYQQIVRKYPDSPFAPMAQERLRALTAGSETPSKK